MRRNEKRRAKQARSRLGVERLDDRIVPAVSTASFASEVQALVAGASQVASTGAQVASAAGLDTTTLPVVGQTLDSILTYTSKFNRLSQALAAVSPSNIHNNTDLVTALRAADPTDTFGLGPDAEADPFYPTNPSVTFTPAVPSQTLSVAPTAAAFGGYFASASLSGSGAVSFSGQGGVSIGADSAGVYLNSGSILSTSATAQFNVSGTVSIGAGVFAAHFSGQAAAAVKAEVSLGDPDQTGRLRLSQVTSNFRLVTDDDSGAGLIGDVTVSVLGVPLVTWGSSTAPQTGAPLLAWHLDEDGSPGDVQINVGTPQFVGTDAIRRAEGKLFGTIPATPFGANKLQTALGGFQEVVNAGEQLQSLYEAISGDYAAALNDFADSDPGDANGDNDLPTSSALPSVASPDETNADPSPFGVASPADLLAFANGKNVDLLTYDSGNVQGPSFGTSVPFPIAGAAVGPIILSLDGEIGVHFYPHYRVSLGLDANGVYANTDPNYTFAKLFTSAEGSITGSVSVLKLAGLADARLGLELGIDAGFELTPAAGGKRYLQDLLNPSPGWLADAVQTASDATPSSKLFFTFGLDNPDAKAANAVNGATGGQLGQWVGTAVQYGKDLGGKASQGAKDFGGTVSDGGKAVLSDLGIGGGGGGGLLSGLGLTDVSDVFSGIGNYIGDAIGAYTGNYVPTADDIVRQGIGISPSDPVTDSDLSDENMDVPRDGIYHYGDSSLPLDYGIERAEYTWSWPLIPARVKGPVRVPAGAASSSPPGAAAPWTIDPDGLLTYSPTSPGVIIVMRPVDGGVQITSGVANPDGSVTDDGSIIVDDTVQVKVNTQGGHNTLGTAPGVNVPITWVSTGQDSVVTQDGPSTITTGGGYIYAGSGPDVITTTGGDGMVFAGTGPNTITAQNAYVNSQGNTTVHSLGGLTMDFGSGTYTADGLQPGDELIARSTPTGPVGKITALKASDGTTLLGAARARAAAGLLVASGSGGAATRYQFDTSGGFQSQGSFTPFPGVAGEVRTAAGDFDGDGVPDVAYVTGPGGGALLRIVSGATGNDIVPVTNLFPGEDLTTIGLFVAAGDIDGDGTDEVAVSADQGGGPRVKIYQIAGGQLVLKQDFLAIEDPTFRGGARIALADVDGDGKADLIASAGFQGGPRIAIWSGADLFAANLTSAAPGAKLVNDFFAFESSLRNGCYVSAGDLGAGGADLVFGAGPGGGPRVLVVSYASLAANVDAALGNPYANFFAFDAGQRGGVRVAVKEVNGAGTLGVVAASGEDVAPMVNSYASTGSGLSTSPTGLTPFNDPTLAGGVFVG